MNREKTERVPEATVMPPFPETVERWVALRTSAKWEKSLAAALERCRVPTFLPLMTKISVYRSKRQATEVPLFGGYVFCSEADFRANKAVPPAVRNRIAQVLPPPDPEELRRELLGIAEFLASHRLVQERVYGKPGDTVRIAGGLFAGQVGVIRLLKPRERKIVLEIKFLGVRLEVDVEEHLIERI
jgi:transcription antitermination factor NusG